MRIEYNAEIEVRGEPTAMSVSREVKEGRIGDTPAWLVITVTESEMGASVDTFYVDKGTLAPVAHNVESGQMKAYGDYGADAIKGEISMGSQSIPIDVPLSAPVSPDGGALEVALTTLPLAEGYETTLRMFDVMSLKVRPWSLKVLGTEKIEVPAGSFDAYKVMLEPLDGGVDATTMYVGVEGPRCLISKSGKLPAMAGGGNSSMEMTKMEKIK
jgi:hypothetical protein